MITMNSTLRQTSVSDHSAMHSSTSSVDPTQYEARPLRARVGVSRVSQTELNRSRSTSSKREPAPKSGSDERAWTWKDVEIHADEAEVQQLIRRAIQSRAIRVTIRPGGGVRIIEGDGAPATPSEFLEQ